VSLTATPAAGSIFSGWSGPCNDNATTCTFPLSASTTVSATFTRQWPLSVTKDGSGTGTVTGNGINCDPVCSIPLDSETAVSLAATPATGSVFVGWSGACSGTATCDLTMTAAQSVTATFVPLSQQFTLGVALTGNGTVIGSPKGIRCGNQCSQSFAVGTDVVLTIKLTKKEVFLGWTGACADSGTTPTCTVKMLHDQAVGAEFR
jgi:hypothetical protein